MEMHQVRYFLAAARTLNFTRAAEDSNVSQPSLTRAIQKLEEELGGELFRRERALTHLTELGKAMLPHLEQAFDAAQAAKLLAKGIGKASVAPLNLGVGVALGGSNFHATLGNVCEALPGFQLSMTSAPGDRLVEQLLHGELDLVIVERPRESHDRLDFIELFEQSYSVAVPENHTLAVRVAPSVGDLDELVWIDTGGEIQSEFREKCAAAGVAPNYRHVATSSVDAVQLLRAGMGCALLPDREFEAEGVRLLAFNGLELSRPVGLASVFGRRRSVAAEAFVRAVRARSWP